MEPLQIALAVSTAIVLFLFGIEHFSKALPLPTPTTTAAAQYPGH